MSRVHPCLSFRKSALFALMLAAGASAALAHEYKAGSLDIGHPWARPAAAGNSAAYMTIVNGGGKPDVLLGASSDAAGKVEIHQTVRDGDVMRMRLLPDGLELPAGGTVELKPGGAHIMLLGVKSELKEGATAPMTLRFRDAGEVRVELKIEKGGHAAEGHKHH
ncbi:MAG: copper chaperone PCu(A)C [Hyphomicrobiales bacterium]